MRVVRCSAAVSTRCLEAGKAYGHFGSFSTEATEACYHSIVHPRAAGMTGDCQPKRLGGGFEVGHEPEVRRLFDWDVRGLSNLTHSITSSVRVSPNQEKQT